VSPAPALALSISELSYIFMSATHVDQSADPQPAAVQSRSPLVKIPFNSVRPHSCTWRLNPADGDENKFYTIIGSSPANDLGGVMLWMDGGTEIAAKKPLLVELEARVLLYDGKVVAF